MLLFFGRGTQACDGVEKIFRYFWVFVIEVEWVFVFWKWKERDRETVVECSWQANLISSKDIKASKGQEPLHKKVCEIFGKESWISKQPEVKTFLNGGQSVWLCSIMQTLRSNKSKAKPLYKTEWMNLIRSLQIAEVVKWFSNDFVGLSSTTSSMRESLNPIEKFNQKTFKVRREMSAENHFCVVETHRMKLKFFGGMSGGDGVKLVCGERNAHKWA